jgi:SagB-type dehydrogenase family enzyme
MALKTAPSGGARHSIEAYVLVRRVEGIAPGLYHYQPASHQLHAMRELSAGDSKAAMLAYLPRQGFYGDASAIVLMTTVFARVQWRYAFARAYRTILAEAGHHAQTFCLVATWLGLAPFCTMALADSRIERDLQIDGVGESVIYAAGVGPRPPDTDWAPWPRKGETPARTANPLGQPQRPQRPPRRARKPRR